MIVRSLKLCISCAILALFCGYSLAQDQDDFFRIDGQPGQKVPKSLLTVVSVDLNEVEFEKALAVISTKGDFKLSFNRSRIPVHEKVTVNMTDAYALEVLLHILKETQTELLVTRDGLLLVVPANEKRKADGIIKGRVIDKSTGKPLSYTNITIVGTELGGITNEDGEFTLENVPLGDLTLQFSFIGYQTERISTTLYSTKHLAVQLEPEAISLGEVVITPGQFTIMGEGPTVKQTLTERDLQTVPFGEDVYRAITRLPGISANDFSAKFTVRGGENEEILLLIDGMELQEPFHLKDIDGGALSIIDVASIQGIDLMTGGFTAEYGDRLSGVFNIKTRRAPQAKKRTSLGVSFMNARFMSEGTFAENKGAWLFSARRGYLDLVLDLMGEQDPPRPVYYDVLGKVSYKLNNIHTLSANVLHAGDRLEYVEDDDDIDRTNYYNSYGWLTLKSFPSPRLFVQSILSYGRLGHGRDGIGYDGNSNIVGFMVDDSRHADMFGFKQDWTFESSGRLQLKWGYDFRKTAAEYDYLSINRSTVETTEGEIVVIDTNRISLQPPGNRFSSFIAGRLRLIPPLAAELGVRYDRNSFTNDEHFSPRLNLIYELGKQTFLRAGWGHFYQTQGIHQMKVAYGENAFHKAEKAEHWVGGFEHTFRNGFNLRLEGYYKELSDLHPDYRKFNNDIEIFPEMVYDRYQLNLRDARSRGVEAYLKYDRGGRISWWASYAFAYAEENIQSLILRGILYQGENRYYPGRFDQRHTVYLDLNYRPNRKWHLNISWQFHTGWPYTATVIESRQTEDGSLEYYSTYAEYNDANYPAYQRFDLRVNRNFYTSNGHISVFLSLINLYNHGNVRNINYSWKWDRGRPILSEENEYWFKLLPSVGVTWNWDH